MSRLDQELPGTGMFQGSRWGMACHFWELHGRQHGQDLEREGSEWSAELRPVGLVTHGRQK